MRKVLIAAVAALSLGVFGAASSARADHFNGYGSYGYGHRHSGYGYGPRPYGYGAWAPRPVVAPVVTPYPAYAYPAPAYPAPAYPAYGYGYPRTGISIFGNGFGFSYVK